MTIGFECSSQEMQPLQWASCSGHADPMERIKALGKAALDSEEGRAAAGLHSALMAELAAYEASVVEDWCCLLSDTSDQKLKQPLLRRAPALLRHARCRCLVGQTCQRRVAWGCSHRRMTVQDGLPRLAVNFDPALVRMLREVRYFLQQPSLPVAIPAAALKVRRPPACESPHAAPAR